MAIGQVVGEDAGDEPRRRIRDVSAIRRFSVYCRARHRRDAGSGLVAVLTTDGHFVTDVQEVRWPDTGHGTVLAMCMACEDLPAFELSVDKIRTLAATRRSEVSVDQVRES